MSTFSLQQREELLQIVAAAAELQPEDTEGLAALTETMPLLVGGLSRAALLWMCASPQAAACIDYVERDEKVSLV